MHSERNSGKAVFLEKDSTNVCFHPKQTTTAPTFHHLENPGSKGRLDNTRSNCKLTLGLILQTISLEPLILFLDLWRV